MPEDNVAIKIVDVREQYDVIYQMMDRLHASEREMFDKTARWEEIAESYMRHIITSIDEHEGSFLIAYVDGKPAGFICGYTEEQDDSRIEVYTGIELYVSDGYVYPEYRRHGIYKKLNQALEQIYLDKGIKRITRYTLATNIRMQQFLVQAGYKPTRYFFEKWIAPDTDEATPLNLKPPAAI